MRALLLALALAACSSSPAELPPPQLPQRTGVDPIVAARAEGVRFLAHGEAPIFQLRFYDDRISIAVDGGPERQFPMTAPTYPRWNGAIYSTSNADSRLIVRILHYRPCPNQVGHSVVEVVLDGAELEGCGDEL